MCAVSTDWETCSEEGCVGVPSDENARCLAHLAPDELAAALEQIGHHGHVDARGVEVSTELLQGILDALPQTPDQRPRFEWADFTAAVFDRHALFGGFSRAVFDSDASFEEATFKGHAWFKETTFKGHASFYRASFEGDVEFGEASFEGEANFYEAAFGARGSFDHVIFKEHAALDHVTFKGDADFGNVSFKGDASFAWTTFKGGAWFTTATFGKGAGFTYAAFEGDVYFDWATFERGARLAWATFHDHAGFNQAIFEGEVEFYGAIFKGTAAFREATFEKKAEFREVTFERNTWFHGAIFEGEADFGGAIFERARNFGPVLVLGMLSLQQASFLQAADLGVSANRLSLAEVRFPESGRVRVRWADIVLDEADFGKPSILTGAVRFGEGFKDRKLVRVLTRGGGRSRRSGRPRVVSIRRANVANLALSNVDLRACRFVGAHNLNQMRIDARSVFAQAGLRATRRRMIAEEHEWRARRPRRWWRSTGRCPAECDFPESFGDAGQLGPDEIAPIYRELRKGLEESKNEPGASDFYYGEMEMRRFDKTRSRAERLILWLYWLVSGYGLRASRAFLSLLVTVLVFAGLLYAWGFPSERSFLDAVTFSAESTTSLFRGPERPLTVAGEWLQIGLRLLGPLFFGLALLSLRGRVKR